jgi:hypothetical protein
MWSQYQTILFSPADSIVASGFQVRLSPEINVPVCVQLLFFKNKVGRSARAEGQYPHGVKPLIQKHETSHIRREKHEQRNIS